jgi:hypothetical protein
VYSLSEEEAKRFDSYWLNYEEGRLVSVKFFHDAKPSSEGDFGAHELVRIWSDTGLVEQYRDKSGKRVLNANGIWETRYLGNAQGYWAVRQTFGQDGEAKDAGSYAELRVTRDDKGRRVFESRYNAAGEPVAEHNGFASATFAFDENDFAVYRRNLNKDGLPINGDRGYAEVRFQFDEIGNFLSEEVYDASGALKNFPAGYADIKFSDFDTYGHPRQIDLRTETRAPFGDMPVVIRTYHPSGLRASNRYYKLDGTQGMDGRGAYEVRYHYDAFGKRTHISRHDVSGQEITAD